MSALDRIMARLRGSGIGEPPWTKEDELDAKDRENFFGKTMGDSSHSPGYEKYFGPQAEKTQQTAREKIRRKAVASVNAYWGIYGVYRENFFQADNDRLARNPIFAVCEKGIMDYLGIVDWEVIDHEEEQVLDAIKFLKNPNPQDTFPTLLKQTARDMIRYDAGAWVKTMSLKYGDNDKQNLLELKAYSGPEFWIEIDRDWRTIEGEDALAYTGPFSAGFTKRYWQHPRAGIFVPFEPKEVVYFVCYPRADSCYGTDFLQELKWYLEYLIDSTKAAGMTFRNGCMPGMKYRHPDYTSVSQLIEANQELEAANMGPDNFNGIVNLIGEEDIEPLTPTNVDMQWLEGQQYVAKIIWAMFGFASSEFIGDDVNRATAYVNRNITKSRMLSPILRKFEEMINNNVLPDLPGYQPGWKFRFKDIVDLDDELKQVQIDEGRQQVASGYMQMGIPLEAALRLAGLDDAKIEQATLAMKEAQANEPSWNQGMPGGGGPMGPPGTGGNLNTNPQAGQPLSPQESSQFYDQGEGGQGPQLYHKEGYSGTDSSQDHEGSDEEDPTKVKKSGDQIEKAEKIYLHPRESPPEGHQVYEGEKGGRYYLGAMAEADQYDLDFDSVEEKDSVYSQINKSITRNGGCFVTTEEPFAVSLSADRFLQGLRGTIKDLNKSGVKIVKARNRWKDKDSSGVLLELLAGGRSAECVIDIPEIEKGKIPDKMLTWHY